MNFTISEHPHGSDGWILDRLGKPTGSVGSKILTPTGKPSTSQEELVNRLVAEIIIGEPDETFQSSAMLRGLELEEEALSFFNLTCGYEFEATGFVDSGLGYGISPDGMDLKNKKGLELKCPLLHTHLGYLAGGVVPKDYVMQCQMGLFVTGYDVWVFGSYYPEMPCFKTEALPDKKIQDALAVEVPKVATAVREKVELIRSMMEVA